MKDKKKDDIYDFSKRKKEKLFKTNFGFGVIT